LSPPVSADSRAFTQLPGFPRRLWTPFSRAEARFPVALGDARRNRIVPPTSPTSKPSSLRRVRSQQLWVAPRPPVDALLRFCPFEAFSLHASDPQTRPNPGVRTRNPDARLQRTAALWCRVRPLPARKALEELSSAASSPLRDWPAPPLGGNSFPRDLSPSKLGRAFRASKYVESGVSPRRCLLPWGLVPLRRSRDFGARAGPGFSRRIHRTIGASVSSCPACPSDLC